MSFSPSESSSESSSSPSSSPSLSKFDPFAVHPFTNCSVTQNGHNPPSTAHSTYAYAYTGRNGHASSQGPPPANGLPTGKPSYSSPKPYTSAPPHNGGIFVPFPQDASLSDLADVLKLPKSAPKTSSSHPDSRTASSQTQTNLTGTKLQPIPTSYTSRKY